MSPSSTARASWHPLLARLTAPAATDVSLYAPTVCAAAESVANALPVIAHLVAGAAAAIAAPGVITEALTPEPADLVAGAGTVCTTGDAVANAYSGPHVLIAHLAAGAGTTESTAARPVADAHPIVPADHVRGAGAVGTAA